MEQISGEGTSLPKESFQIVYPLQDMELNLLSPLLHLKGGCP